MSHEVSRPSDAVANGAEKRPRDVSVGRPRPVGRTKAVSFEGTYLRTSGIGGRVSADCDGLAGVTVSLGGGPENVASATTTDASGRYAFTGLRAGKHTIGISGFDVEDVAFSSTSSSATVAVGKSKTVARQLHREHLGWDLHTTVPRVVFLISFGTPHPNAGGRALPAGLGFPLPPLPLPNHFGALAGRNETQSASHLLRGGPFRVLRGEVAAVHGSARPPRCSFS